MKWDRQLKRALMERIDAEYVRNPNAGREEVTDNVLDDLHYLDPGLNTALLKVSARVALSVLVGEYVRRTRGRMKQDILKGQETDDDIGKPPPWEAINRMMLTFPIGGGKTDDKWAPDCTREEIRAARMYYLEQRATMDQRARCLAVLDALAGWDELPPGATVRDLYRAA